MDGENIEMGENSRKKRKHGENDWIDCWKIEPVAKNEEGDITKEPTKLVVETIEPVSENNFLVVVAPNLIIREGKNWHPPIWLTDYNSDKGLSKEDEENMAFLMISDDVNFE